MAYVSSLHRGHRSELLPTGGRLADGSKRSTDGLFAMIWIMRPQRLQRAMQSPVKQLRMDEPADIVSHHAEVQIRLKERCAKIICHERRGVTIQTIRACDVGSVERRTFPSPSGDAVDSIVLHTVTASASAASGASPWFAVILGINSMSSEAVGSDEVIQGLYHQLQVLRLLPIKATAVNARNTFSGMRFSSDVEVRSVVENAMVLQGSAAALLAQHHQQTDAAGQGSALDMLPRAAVDHDPSSPAPQGHKQNASRLHRVTRPSTIPQTSPGRSRVMHEAETPPSYHPPMFEELVDTPSYSSAASSIDGAAVPHVASRFTRTNEALERVQASPDSSASSVSSGTSTDASSSPSTSTEEYVPASARRHPQRDARDDDVREVALLECSSSDSGDAENDCRSVETRLLVKSLFDEPFSSAKEYVRSLLQSTLPTSFPLSDPVVDVPPIKATSTAQAAAAPIASTTGDAQKFGDDVPRRKKSRSPQHKDRTPVVLVSRAVGDGSSVSIAPRSSASSVASSSHRSKPRGDLAADVNPFAPMLGAIPPPALAPKFEELTSPTSSHATAFPITKDHSAWLMAAEHHLPVLHRQASVIDHSMQAYIEKMRAESRAALVKPSSFPELKNSPPAAEQLTNNPRGPSWELDAPVAVPPNPHTVVFADEHAAVTQPAAGDLSSSGPSSLTTKAPVVALPSTADSEVKTPSHEQPTTAAASGAAISTEPIMVLYPDSIYSPPQAPSGSEPQNSPPAVISPSNLPSPSTASSPRRLPPRRRSAPILEDSDNDSVDFKVEDDVPSPQPPLRLTAPPPPLTAPISQRGASTAKGMTMGAPPPMVTSSVRPSMIRTKPLSLPSEQQLPLPVDARNPASRSLQDAPGSPDEHHRHQQGAVTATQPTPTVPRFFLRSAPPPSSRFSNPSQTEEPKLSPQSSLVVGSTDTQKSLPQQQSQTPSSLVHIASSRFSAPAPLSADVALERPVEVERVTSPPKRRVSTQRSRSRSSSRELKSPPEPVDKPQQPPAAATEHRCKWCRNVVPESHDDRCAHRKMKCKRCGVIVAMKERSSHVCASRSEGNVPSSSPVLREKK